MTVTIMSTTSVLESSSPTTKGYRMVALDLDGTLLNSQHQLSEGTKTYLRQLDQKGFTIIIATGRALCSVYETIASLNLPRPIPVVCSNGAEGYLCSTNEHGQVIDKKQLFSTPVPQVVAQRTLELSKELGFVTQYYVGDDIYADPREPHHLELTNLYRKLTGSETIYIQDDFESALLQGLPSKQLVLCPHKEQDTMIQAFEQELAKDVFLINGNRAHIIRGNLGWFLEVLHPDVCKGSGLQKMCQHHLKIPLEECIAFGDGDNDQEFLQVAGKGIAMKNAVTVTKAVADEVIDLSNDQDGVVKTLETLEKQGCLVFGSK